MNNPILSIRKGAEVYDDSLAESERRLQAAEAAALRHPPAKRRRPHARRARMTFLPLVVLAIGLVVVFRIIPRPRQIVLAWPDGTLFCAQRPMATRSS